MAQTDEQIFASVEEILAPLNLVCDDYKLVEKEMGSAMVRGLQLATRDAASVKMFPSFVTRLPNGKGMNFHFYLHFFRARRILGA